MRGHRVIHVRAPQAGVYKRSSFQEQPPFSAYDALNVWPCDYKANLSRDRVAVRPAFGAFAEAGAGPVNMQAIVHIDTASTLLRQPMRGLNGSLERWDDVADDWVLVGGSNVDTGRPVCAFGYLQKLYILNQTLEYKVYNNDGHTVSSWSGSPPPDCGFGCVWDDRIVLSGDPDNPHIVHFSRQGEPTDWAEAEGAGAPFSSTSIEGGNISEPVTAVIPHHRQCLLVGGWNTWHVYRGNPRKGGSLSRINSATGPVCWTAWCYTADGWLYYLSRDGLYRMQPGCGDTPQSVSRERIPSELLQIDGINTIAHLAYDVRYRGIYILIAGQSAAYWYDLEKQGFWPITIPSTNLQSLHHFDQFDSATTSGVLLGGDEMHRLDTSISLEAGATAFCKIGPIKLSQNMDEGACIYEANAHLGENTNDTTGTMTLSTGRDSEEAIAQEADMSHEESFANILANNNRMPMRGSGHAAFIDLQLGDEGTHFSCERIDLHTAQYGKDR